ncbi:TIGR03643 family protein [Marinirhabdus gelatinilytica]|nr:TIGR03643 family protein [Marinirhabdus gelatinilytica]
MKNNFTARDMDRILEMAWEDRTPFDAIKFQFGISEQEVITIMRREMKPASFRMWRKRVQGRITKHSKLRNSEIDRFKSSRQKQITHNKISKRN